MAVSDGPYDVFWPKRRVTAEEYLWQRRLHCFRVDLWHVPAVELDADVALYPGEGILLANRYQHVVAEDMLIRLTARDQIAPAALVVFGFHFLEQHASQPAPLMGEFLGDKPIEDRNTFVRRVLFFPRRR